MDKHIFLNCIFFVFTFLYCSLPRVLSVRFWRSLLFSCSSFPNASNQFYGSAERYLVYLLARIEQQLIISLFSASCVLWCLARGFYISCTQIFGRHLMWFSAGKHLGKQSSTQERNHTHQVQCPQANCLTRNLLHFSAAHMCNNFDPSLKNISLVSPSKKKMAVWQIRFWVETQRRFFCCHFLSLAGLCLMLNKGRKN